MAAPVSREYITLSYHPQQEVSGPWLHEVVRTIEGFLQRMELRIEALQEAVAALEARVAALE